MGNGVGKYLIWCRYIDHNINLVYFKHLDTSSAHEMMMTRRKKDNHKQCKSFILMTVFLAFLRVFPGGLCLFLQLIRSHGLKEKEAK